MSSVRLSDEKMIFRGKISVWSVAPVLFFGFIFLFSFPVLGIGLMVLAFIDLVTKEVGFTNKRLYIKTGFLSRKSIELSISKIESVQVNQGVIGNILNYGSLVVSGAGNPQAVIKGVSDPSGFRTQLLEYQDSLA